ncbi:response regulator [bacterium]|nr:response regulator [bacterium]
MDAHQKILVSESEPIIAMDLEHQLVEWGFKHSEVVPRRSQVHNMVRRKKPNLVIMDNDMKNGDQDIRSAVQLNKKYNVSIILLIDWMTEELKRTVQSLKSVYCIPKPFDRDELHRLVEEALQRKKQAKLKKMKAA